MYMTQLRELNAIKRSQREEFQELENENIDARITNLLYKIVKEALCDVKLIHVLLNPGTNFCGCTFTAYLGDNSVQKEKPYLSFNECPGKIIDRLHVLGFKTKNALEHELFL